MIKKIKKLFDQSNIELRKAEKIAKQIDAMAEDMRALSDENLQAKTEDFRQRLDNGETLDDIIVEAFAVVREASLRVTDKYPFYVQLLGGIAIHNGNIAEMKTGEGKTLTAVMPAYLNALSGNGVHIITVNEYLASREAEGEIADLFRWLGLSVGLNLRSLTKDEKQAVYNSDILYSTNNEIGFDYLRDNMVIYKEQRVQRPLNFAIIDEIDSILIDEARTPLIISGGAKQTTDLYKMADRFAKGLKVDDEFTYDEKTKASTLTTEGMTKAERAFNIENLYDLQNSALVHHIQQAMRANYGMKSDFDYVVQEGEIVIVDQFTGRLMAGRAFSDGLHQAIQAKENVSIKQEMRTLATITYQNMFRMYNKLSGMTGTAKTEEEEFINIYNMFVVEIPTNKPIVRDDKTDLIFPVQEAKFRAIVAEIKERHELGQPILVGTIAVETSELVSKLLKRAKIKHEVLNAKNHHREADIIAKAGEIGSVTIATNMAGRGTDIKLGEGVIDLGGLCVIGTERHESRRIDNQLRGRSGRQGDPGVSQFFVSLKDELIIRFGSDRLSGMIQSLGLPDDQPIQSKMISRALESAQSRVEGQNFDARKSLLQYDDVMGKQREIMYARRNEVLDRDSVHDSIIEVIRSVASNLVNSHLGETETLSEEDYKHISAYINEGLFDVEEDKVKSMEPNELIEFIHENVTKAFERKLREIPNQETKDEFEKVVYLRVIDFRWMNHIDTMAQLREGIGLRSYAQQNPLRSYTMEGFSLFDKMLHMIEQDCIRTLLKAELRQNLQRSEVEKGVTNEGGKKVRKKQPKRVTKVGRNDPCPCGSGKKYKQCHGR